MINIDVPTVQNAGDILQLALCLYDIPIKELALDLGCSIDVIYAYFKGKRNIPDRVKQKLACRNVMTFASVASATTGFWKIFGYQKVNREIQDMIIGLKMQDKEVSEILNKFPEMLWNKKSRQDLTEKDIEDIEVFVKKISEWQCSAINLTAQFEITYGLKLVKHLQGKENPPAVTSRRAM